MFLWYGGPGRFVLSEAMGIGVFIVFLYLYLGLLHSL